MIMFLLLLSTLFDVKTLTVILLIVWLMDKACRAMAKAYRFRYSNPDATIIRTRHFNAFWHINPTRPKL